MKIRRIIYIIIGILFILVNLLTDLLELSSGSSYGSDTAYNIGYFLGSHLLLFIGLIFLRQAYKLGKKIKQAKLNTELNTSIHEIGVQPDRE